MKSALLPNVTQTKEAQVSRKKNSYLHDSLENKPRMVNYCPLLIIHTSSFYNGQDKPQLNNFALTSIYRTEYIYTYIDFIFNRH